MSVREQQHMRSLWFPRLGPPVFLYDLVGIAFTLAEVVEHQLTGSLLGKAVSQVFLYFLLRDDNPFETTGQK